MFVLGGGDATVIVIGTGVSFIGGGGGGVVGGGVGGAGGVGGVGGVGVSVVIVGVRVCNGLVRVTGVGGVVVLADVVVVAVL